MSNMYFLYHISIISLSFSISLSISLLLVRSHTHSLLLYPFLSPSKSAFVLKHFSLFYYHQHLLFCWCKTPPPPFCCIPYFPLHNFFSYISSLDLNKTKLLLSRIVVKQVYLPWNHYNDKRMKQCWPGIEIRCVKKMLLWYNVISILIHRCEKAVENNAEHHCFHLPSTRLLAHRL